jgi:hypothetical protein
MLSEAKQPWDQLEADANPEIIKDAWLGQNDRPGLTEQSTLQQITSTCRKFYWRFWLFGCELWHG